MTTAQSDLKVTLERGGKTYDITEHFRELYDDVVQSLDWGSGFLDTAEMLRVWQVGAAAGFDVTSSEIAGKIGLDLRFPLKNPLEGTQNLPREERFALHPLYDEWRAKRDTWVQEHAPILYGDPPTWESIGVAIEQTEEAFDEIG